MKTTFLLISCAALITSCTSTSNLFQDGKTLGKGNFEPVLSASLNPVPEFTYDSVRRKVEIKPDKMVVPWGQFQGQYGVSEKVDLGGSFGVGPISFGMQGFAKFALLPTASKTGISLFTLAGFAVSDEDEVKELQTSPPAIMTFGNLLVAMPVSFPISDSSQLVLQPMYSLERFNLRMPDDDNGPPVKTHRNYQVFKLGVGLINNHVHYNICLSFYRDTKQIVPSFGVGFKLW